jgi:hypothetical protein
MKIFLDFAQVSKKLLAYIFLASLFFRIFAVGDLEHFVPLIRCLQIMLNLPIYKAVMPAHTVILIGMLIKVAKFDIFPAEWTTDLIFGYPDREMDFYNNIHMAQVKAIGYDSPYIVRNLGTVAVLTFLYIAKVVTFFLLISVGKFLKSERLRFYARSIKNQVFFRDIFILVIDVNMAY